MEYIKRYIFSLLTILLITTLSLMPSQEFPQVNVQFADKWAHWVMYGFLTIVLGIESTHGNILYSAKVWEKRERKDPPKYKKGTTLWRLLAIFLFASLYGGLMELGQAYLTTSRHGDWLDVWANSFGALCALILLLVYDFSSKKRR